MRFSIICGMALRDYWHERALSLCAVLALATVLAPLLILFGVRNGVISNLQERLLQDPRNLEIVPVGSGKYGKAFFEELRKRQDVGYVVPQTRAIAATIGLLPASEKKGGLSPNPVNVSLIPSGAGDPLTRRFAGSAALKDDEIILTAPAADKLGARAGTILTGRVTRARGMTREQAAFLGGGNVTSMSVFAGKDIPDPYGQGKEVYRATLCAIRDCIPKIIAILNIGNENQ